MVLLFFNKKQITVEGLLCDERGGGEMMHSVGMFFVLRASNSDEKDTKIAEEWSCVALEACLTPGKIRFLLKT